MSPPEAGAGGGALLEDCFPRRRRLLRRAGSGCSAGEGCAVSVTSERHARRTMTAPRHGGHPPVWASRAGSHFSGMPAPRAGPTQERPLSKNGRGRRSDEQESSSCSQEWWPRSARPAPAGANHALSHKAQEFTAKLNRLQKYPVFEFADYAFYDLSAPSVEVLDTGIPPRRFRSCSTTRTSPLSTSTTARRSVRAMRSFSGSRRRASASRSSRQPRTPFPSPVASTAKMPRLR
jgi:hypothetical protein